MLYVDDTIILAETPESLQNALNSFENYCTWWKLKVNLNKTKVLIFCKRKSRHIQSFKLFGHDLDIVDSYSYLGVTFNYTGTFLKDKKLKSEQVQKALFSLYRKLRNISVPVDLQLKLFDTLILPILTYGCEVWRYENVQVLEKIHLQFCRNILKIRTSTFNFMSYGEIGRVPIDVVINVRMISFWNKLLTYNQKLSSILYRIMYMLSQRENVNFKWINHIKSIFDNVGPSYVWNQQNPIHLVELKLSEAKAHRSIYTEMVQSYSYFF